MATKSKGGGLAALVRRCSGDVETCSGGPGQGGERNQAEQTPKVPVLNAATSGRLGSWVFLGQASARLEDWKELKPQTLLPLEGSGAFWVLQGHPGASKRTYPRRDDRREAPRRRNHLQNSSKPPWNTRCSSLAATTQKGLKERRWCLPQHLTRHPSTALFSASSSKTRLSPMAPCRALPWPPPASHIHPQNAPDVGRWMKHSPCWRGGERTVKELSPSLKNEKKIITTRLQEENRVCTNTPTLP